MSDEQDSIADPRDAIIRQQAETIQRQADLLVELQDNVEHLQALLVRAGFKYALFDDGNRWLTFQLRGYFPSGDGNVGLGTGHASIEPGLLFHVEDGRFDVFGEFKAWIPLGGSIAQNTAGPFAGRNFSGTILRYGFGVGYDLFQQRVEVPPAAYGGNSYLHGYDPHSYDPRGYYPPRFDPRSDYPHHRCRHQFGGTSLTPWPSAWGGPLWTGSVRISSTPLPPTARQE